MDPVELNGLHGAHGFPWSSMHSIAFMEIMEVNARIPWNSKCSMEFHAMREILWKPWSCMAWNFMEFHRESREVPLIPFHRIHTWILELNAKSQWKSEGSMEFYGMHGIPRNPWNSMEFHNIPLGSMDSIPWNSLESMH